MPVAACDGVAGQPRGGQGTHQCSAVLRFPFSKLGNSNSGVSADPKLTVILLEAPSGPNYFGRPQAHRDARADVKQVAVSERHGLCALLTIEAVELRRTRDGTWLRWVAVVGSSVSRCSKQGGH